MAKSRPGTLNYCSAGSGTSPHLVMELFKTAAGIHIVHVPHKGSVPCLVDTYYDTPGRALWKAGLTLRVRADGDRWIQVVQRAGKGAGGPRAQGVEGKKE